MNEIKITKRKDEIKRKNLTLNMGLKIVSVEKWCELRRKPNPNLVCVSVEALSLF